MIEGLKAIPGLDGYAARADGTIWTEMKFRGRGANRRMYRSGEWRQIPGGLDVHGYRIIRVSPAASENGKSQKYYVHALVLRAFVGPRPDGMQCRHLNGNRSDSRLENLTWGTVSQNQLDRVPHGTSNRGEAHWNAKLTGDRVALIKASLTTSDPLRVVAERFDVSLATVHSIKHGRTWAWIS